MRTTVRAAMAVLALAATAGVARAQAAACPPNVYKIGYVNRQAVVDASPLRAGIDSAFAKAQAPIQAQFNKLKDSLDKMVARYDSAKAKLTPAEQAKREQALQDFDLDLRKKGVEFQQQLGKKQEELAAPLLEAVKTVLDDLRKQECMAIIFDHDPTNSNIAAADKNLDLTEQAVLKIKARGVAAGAVKR
jgi:outer membrane protein